MSVDEVAWPKWHYYVINMVDIGKLKVIWTDDSHGKSVLYPF
jgi:hypothetical protein